MSGILEWRDKKDKEMTLRIATMKTAKWMDYCLWIPVHMFDPMVVPFLLMIVSVLYP